MALKSQPLQMERKNRVHLHSSRNAKQQEWNRELINLIVKLVNENDHESLALIARNTGIPPQLRHVVWSVLLKYHPMVISPNIYFNTLVLKEDENGSDLHYFPETRSEEEILGMMESDIHKYFQLRTPGPLPQEIEQVLRALQQCVMKFLKKWGKFCKYESGLVWIALGLAEWFPIHGNKVLSGKKYHHNQNILPIVDLYHEYPMPQHLIERLPKAEFKFEEIYERLIMVLFHSPQLQNIPDKCSYHIFRGGSLNQLSQLFFKIFAKTLPELFQPITEEGGLHESRKSSWLYWWLKTCGSKVLHRQDRGRIWDLLLGWRPRPQSINYYLSYNDKSFEGIYRSDFKMSKECVQKICKYGHDQFWFPDLVNLRFGQDGLEDDKDIFRELIRRNKLEIEGHEANLNYFENQEQIPYSTLDSHVQLLFIFVAIIQHNEFKLLEFEETEISEFLNNIPLISKDDDYNFKKLYDDETISGSSTDTEESSTSSSRPSTSNHMIFEVGTDDKTAHSFDDLFQQAGDIWRKWAWEEMEEFVEG